MRSLLWVKADEIDTFQLSRCSVLDRQRHRSLETVKHLVDLALQTKASWAGRTGAINSTASALGLPQQRLEFTKCESPPIARGAPLGLSFSFFDSLSSKYSNRDDEPCDALF